MSEHETTTRRLRLAGSTLVGLLFGVVVVLLVVQISRTANLADAIRETQKTNTAKADQRDEQLQLIRQTARQIKSCTTPNQPCSDRNQRETAKAIGAIGANNARAAAAASSCAAQIPNPTYDRVYRCTVSTLTHAGRAP